MSKPDALRLAAELEACPTISYKTHAAELRRLHAEKEALREQRDALLEALKMAWPIIEAERYKQDCSYGKNFVQTKADRARSVYNKACAAIAKAEGQ